MPNQALSAADKIPFTLGQLVVFRTMALSGSGAAAALTLSVSQPAISKSLALLEQVRGFLFMLLCQWTYATWGMGTILPALHQQGSRMLSPFHLTQVCVFLSYHLSDKSDCSDSPICKPLSGQPQKSSSCQSGNMMCFWAPECIWLDAGVWGPAGCAANRRRPHSADGGRPGAAALLASAPSNAVLMITARILRASACILWT